MNAKEPTLNDALFLPNGVHATRLDENLEHNNVRRGLRDD